MKKRQLIPGMNNDLQLNTINEIKELFGENFLTKGRDLNIHQLKILWNRVDYLSTVELYLIGYSIKHNKHNNDWIEDFKSKVIKNKEGSIRGFIYEAFISSIIKDSILAEPSQESYDLKIENSGLLKINLSIKKMILSEKEIAYKKSFEELEIKYKKILQTNKLNGISLIIEATKFDYEKIYNIIKNVPRLIDKYPYFEGMIDDMNVFVSKMKSDYELFEQKLSYQFNLFIPFEKIERARFIKKLKKSVDNINNLDVKENELNSILIGLSPAQSIYEAKKILEKEMNKGICKLDDDLMFIPLNEVDNVDLNDKYKNIFSIILAKHIPVVDKKNNTTHIRHEFAFVFNTKNAIKFKDKLKLFSFPIELGSIGYIEKESDESYLLFLDKKITNHYVYQSICKHEFIKEPKDNMIYNLSDIGRYKENTITFIKDGSCCTISPFNYGKYDSLLIL
ncbi:MAG: hypothetical protein PHS78_09615 [Aliarcobacter skirrowii]|uniref:hypothetical protein n=1 Tax=Aliarcobacter skirrowii TaxID=28200 RepID=UPI0024320240|nr:hypothetical protein [Aliarcobacter skirrowii]MDD2509277.1 hypothetical protein [Aliarcobacter skirrowii]MDD3497414.1 hypothetical protein [Aliarcobacter skirrowii]